MDLKKRSSPMRGLLPHLPDETMDPTRMRIRTRGRNEMSRQAYTRDHTAWDFKNGLPIGNGDIGCMIRGAPSAMHFSIGKNDLWWDDYESPVPCFLPGGIGEVRERVAAGDASLRMDLMKAHNNRSNEPIQTTAAELTLHLAEGGMISGYSETLDMASSCVRTRCRVGSTNGSSYGGTLQTCTAVSRSEGVLMIHASAENMLEIGGFRFELTRPPMNPPPYAHYCFTKEQEAEYLRQIETFYSPEPFVDGRFGGFTMRLRAGEDPDSSPDRRYTVMLTEMDGDTRYYAAGHSVLAEGRAEQNIRILLTVVSSFDAEDTYAEAKWRLSDAIARGGASLAIAGDEGRSFWDRSWIRLPDRDAERVWYWGLYEAASARCPGKFAPAYLAPWHSCCYGNWGHHILTYEQTKSNLGLLASNRAELLEPWFRLCRIAEEPLKRFTSAFYGMKGTCFPHAISGTGEVVYSSIFLNGTCMNVSTTGEAVKYCWDYYDFTRDEDYLREIGYPILKEAALFFSDYLQTDPATGQLYIFPSRTQEFTGSPARNDEYMTDTIVDTALFKFVLRRTAEAARILGVDEELAARFEKDADGMRQDYATWPNGVWKASADWDDPTIDYGTKSVSDLTPIAVTDEVDAWRGSPEMREAARKTVDAIVPRNRLPWDMSFGILGKLRMGDRDYARLALRMMPKCREGGNLERRDACDFVSDNDLSRDGQQDFFADKGAAYLSEVINEMLLQSQGGVIRLFPAYPEDFGDAAFFSLRARGAFLVSAEFRDGEVAYGIIRSLKGGVCTVADPFGGECVVRCLENGEEIPCQKDADGNLSFETAPMFEYAVERRGRPLESFPLRG